MSVMSSAEQPLIEAHELSNGDCFRKRNGTYVYIKLSDSSVKYSGLDSNLVWGVCFNGNVTTVKPTTKVHRVALRDVYQNLVDLEEWEAMVGCKERSIA